MYTKQDRAGFGKEYDREYNERMEKTRKLISNPVVAFLDYRLIQSMAYPF